MKTYEVNDYKDKLKEIKEESNFETLKLQEIETLNQEKKESISNMAEEGEEIIDEVPDENIEENLKEEEEGGEGGEGEGGGGEGEEGGGGEGEEEEEKEDEESREKKSKMISEDKESEKKEERPPPYPLPSGVGEGVPIKQGGKQESVLSSSPLTDSAVMVEMKKADERCVVLSKEIEQLKQEIAALSNKKDLTDDDTLIIHEKQDEVMKKLAEFEQITRKLQRLLGLTDISSSTFAKMFDMQPFLKPSAVGISSNH